MAMLLAGLLLTPSATVATTSAITARVVTSEERPRCKYLGLVAVRKALGPNKPGGALKKALLKVQAMGGDGLFLIEQSQSLFDGASVSGEALLCAPIQLR